MSRLNHVKAHLPVIIDYLGLAAGIALIVYSSKTIVDDRASPILAIIYSSLVLGHFLVPIGRRTPVLYGTLLIVGIVSTVFYAVDMVRNECGYQVLIGKPRDLHTPTIPKDPKHPFPAEPFLNCEDVAGAWWLNLIVTLYVDFVFAIALLQRNSHGRIRLPDTETETGTAPA